MKNVIIIVLLVLSFQKGWTQKIEEITHREINVHFNDSSIKADVLLADKKPQLNNSIDYYWYHNNAIKSNQGDYKGRLLDGQYQVSTKKGDLITKGSFKKGSKSGEWKKWDEKGRLISINIWRNGVRKGTYQKYDEGKLVEKGTYKKGLLHGKKIVYKSDTVFGITTYKKGKEVVKKEKEKKQKEDDSSSKTKDNKKKTPFWKKDKEKVAGSKNIKDSEKKQKQQKSKKDKKIKKEKQKVKKTGEKKVPKEKKKPQVKSKKKG